MIFGACIAPFVTEQRLDMLHEVETEELGSDLRSSSRDEPGDAPVLCWSVILFAPGPVVRFRPFPAVWMNLPVITNLSLGFQPKGTRRKVWKGRGLPVIHGSGGRQQAIRSTVARTARCSKAVTAL